MIDEILAELQEMQMVCDMGGNNEMMMMKKKKKIRKGIMKKKTMEKMKHYYK